VKVCKCYVGTACFCTFISYWEALDKEPIKSGRWLYRSLGKLKLSGTWLSAKLKRGLLENAAMETPSV
jgi:hypothetical protein